MTKKHLFSGAVGGLFAFVFSFTATCLIAYCIRELCMPENEIIPAESVILNTYDLLPAFEESLNLPTLLGDDNGYIDLDKKVSRADFALLNSFDIEKKNVSQLYYYDDVPSEHPAFYAVGTAPKLQNKGNFFNPDDCITLVEALAIKYQQLGCPPILNTPLNNSIITYRDIYKDALNFANSRGIISKLQKRNPSLNANSSINLGESVYIIYTLTDKSILDQYVNYLTQKGVSKALIFEEQIINNADLVYIKEHMPDIYCDIKYATTDNITKTVIYEDGEPLLRYGTLLKLKNAQEKLAPLGYSLLIWDAYRPADAQFKLWEIMPDGNFIANPYKGYSSHTRGNTVDLSLVKLNGEAVDMPTSFDDFTKKADRDYSDVTELQKENALLLENIMIECGFIPYKKEWWHYSDDDNYDPIEEGSSYATPIHIEGIRPKVIVNGIEKLSAEVTIKVTAVGDCVLGSDYRFSPILSFDAYANKYPDDYFFKNVNHIFSADDITIANAENVFTNKNLREKKEDQNNREFWFKGKPRYANIFKIASVEAVNVANNHCYDYGKEGLEQSKNELKKYSIEPFGNGTISIIEKNNIKVALLGYSLLGEYMEEGIDEESMKVRIGEDMEKAKQLSDIQIVSFHWGIEKSINITPQQKDFGYFAIECGADLVLGHHPHVVQEIGEYKGVNIVYSLGNFVYGGAIKTVSKDTIIYNHEFTIRGNVITHKYSVIDALIYPGSHNNYQPIIRGYTKYK